MAEVVRWLRGYWPGWWKRSEGRTNAVAEGFTCAVEKEEYRSACKNLSKYPGSQYCVLHEPAVEKNKQDFLKVKKSKLAEKDYDFGGTVFPVGTSNFQGAKFDADTRFAGATFFRETNFSGAKFSGEVTDFSEAKFSGKETNFSNATFAAEWTKFSNATFYAKCTNFSGARFNAYTDFQRAALTRDIDFRTTTFMEKVEFWGTRSDSDSNLIFEPQAWVWFGSHIVKPELLTFHTVELRPGWFINADVRKVDFTDVDWYGISHETVVFKSHKTVALKDRVRGATEALKKRAPKQAWNEFTTTALDEEIRTLEAQHVSESHSLLAQACRRLSANAEENREYQLANEFHYWSMDALRKKSWRSLGLVGTLYWALSGYGERPWRASCVLVGMWAFFFAILCMLTGSIEHVGQAMLYSLAAIVRLTDIPAMAQLHKLLQPPGPGLCRFLFQFLVTAEGILGPLQIALLALAIRRQVMR